ncbi:MAG: UDP-N-acetylmuramoyl-L-alanyl-D-glutamate--2,6-diaminopimelate ligase [Rickettsiales bacterium]|jgi:UDP-N-acetylmuramoyl-L-alanyl-D-glutamate--2,6-diaminopimelate ligase|nr:UDP-N-acetylmuramoyl-L-alanyl-D-glutamate--2,6-diaminopimelate ligase [Rickettsiales bacterium]
MKINGIEITGMTNDSRRVQPGWAFFAVDGARQRGTDYIPAAESAGASIIITDENYKGKSFKVPDIRQFLAETAAQFFKPLPENIVAVTGTKGKSSIVHFVRYVLEKMGKDAASIGSIGLTHRGVSAGFADSTTTPDPIVLCDVMHKLKAQGCDYIAMEASSQGLAQSRLNALPIKVAAFTNLFRDHISEFEHKDMEDYFAAKKKLFTEVLPADGVAVLNADIPEYAELAALAAPRRVISYGKNGADIKLLDAVCDARSQRITAAIFGKIYEYELKAAGGFQSMNSLCAIGMLVGLGFDAADIVRAIEGAPAATGRMQFVGSPVKDGGVYVDYAYTPDSLENVLTFARGFCKGRLMSLFGAGGERDPARRFGCGEVAERLADVVYITDDNPRNEDPAKIREQIAGKCPKGIVIADGRGAAIRRAVSDMKDGDILIISGKGHEDYQLVGSVKLHFSDFEEAAKAIAENI